jgi:hypothetical protein
VITCLGNWFVHSWHHHTYKSYHIPYAIPGLAWRSLHCTNRILKRETCETYLYTTYNSGACFSNTALHYISLQNFQKWTVSVILKTWVLWTARFHAWLHGTYSHLMENIQAWKCCSSCTFENETHF